MDTGRLREGKKLAASHPEVIVPATGAELRPPSPKMGSFYRIAWPSPDGPPLCGKGTVLLTTLYHLSLCTCLQLLSMLPKLQAMKPTLSDIHCPSFREQERPEA